MNPSIHLGVCLDSAKPDLRIQRWIFCTSQHIHQHLIPQQCYHYGTPRFLTTPRYIRQRSPEANLSMKGSWIRFLIFDFTFSWYYFNESLKSRQNDFFLRIRFLKDIHKICDSVTAMINFVWSQCRWSVLCLLFYGLCISVSITLQWTYFKLSIIPQKEFCAFRGKKKINK